MSCWAAALQSWLKVCCPATDLDENGILALFTSYQTPCGTIELAGLRAIEAMFHMDSEELDGARLTADYLAAKLRLGHLYLTYAPGPAPDIGHSVVVYGAGLVAAELMDPFAGYITRPYAFFTSRTRAFTAWPRGGRGSVPAPRGLQAGSPPACGQSENRR
jgi:hypothetical protein